MTVLVIDDDADARANLRDILEMDGYPVEAAGTAAEALARDDWGRYGAVILDRRLPDGSAEGLLPQLRRLAPDAAVVIVTGYADVQATIAAFRLGAADYVIKPINPDELRARLGRIAEHRRDRAALRAANEERERALAELRARTEEVQAMSQQLWQAAKLATLGELAASIAHELNNPLATVSLRVESLLGRLPEGDPRRRPLEVVEQEVERMGGLVANLLQFSRRGRDQVSTVDVRAELSTSLDLVLHQMRRRGIGVVKEFAAGTPPVHADRQKVRQVFLNLLTNACDAMARGGTLTLRSAAGRLAGGGPAALVEVADTGVGIGAEHLPRVMEPFFTTKEEGRGTGLGLAICRRIVQEHGGAIRITSESGKGTTVQVALPAPAGAAG